MANNSIITIKGKNVILYRAYTENGDLSATEYLAPTKIKLGINNQTPSISDTDLSIPIPINNGTINDDGSNTMTGSDGGDNSTDNTTTYKPGGNVTDNTAQNLIKNDTNATAVWAISNLAAEGTIIIDTYYVGLNIYIKDAAALAKFVSSGTCFELKIGSDSSNYYSLTKEASDFSVGWNWISSYSDTVADLDETGTVSGDIDYFAIEITTNNATDEFAAGDVVYDLLRTWQLGDTLIDFQTGYPTFDYTNNEVTTRGYITSIQANGFDVSGLGEFNEDTTKLMTGEDTFTAESKGESDEFAFIVKNRIL